MPTLIHLAETRDEVKTAQERFHRRRWPISTASAFSALACWRRMASACHDPDIALLKARGVGVSHNPESNMKLASGTAPVTAYLRAGVALGLGTDGAASNNDLDMFEAMRMASLLHKLQTNDPRARQRADRPRHGDDRRRPSDGHGQADRFARAGQARRSDQSSA